MRDVVREAESSSACADLLALYKEAVVAVSPEAKMPRVLPVATFGRTLIIAIGKAAAEMMRVAVTRTRPGTRVKGLIVTCYGHLHPSWKMPADISAIEAAHPFPDENSVRAAEEVLTLVSELRAGDQLLVLLSGGGSALVAAPAPGVELADKREVTRALLHSGATISEINCVRKHLSAIKGGRLAQAARAAHVSTWIISDIPGDDPSFVCSGPTVADETTLAMARDIVAQYGITLPPRAARALEDPANETPPMDALGLAGGEVRIIARARDALAAASELARVRGYEVSMLGDQLQAEARHLGASHAALARRLGKPAKRIAIISGGEATVHVRNPAGRGGRNQEYLLSLAITLEGAPGIHALACDTDGIDGTAQAAGAIVTPTTLARARQLGMDPADYLMRNDSYSFFERLGDLVVTGPTFTNVNDFRVILCDSK